MGDVAGVGGSRQAAGARVPPQVPSANGPYRVSVTNDRLVCFLWDEAHGETIQSASPSLLQGFHRDTALGDDRLRDLALRGALLAYELYREDDISVEISVGAALSSVGRWPGRWMKPQSGYLDLPSGRLRVDSLGSMPFGPAVPTAPGSAIPVPPGRYVVSLHRFDCYASRFLACLPNTPSEVIRLTPVGPTRLTARPASMLLYPEAPVENWEGAYQVQSGRFVGRLVGEVGSLKSLAFNLDRVAAGAMDLQPGMYLEVRTGAHTYRALYVGDFRMDQIVEAHGGYTLAELRAAAPFLAYMDHWQRPRRKTASTVVVMSGSTTGEYDFSGLREGAEVSVTVASDRREPLRWAAGA